MTRELDPIMALQGFISPVPGRVEGGGFRITLIRCIQQKILEVPACLADPKP